MNSPVERANATVQCFGKEPYRTPGLARKVARRRNSSFRFRGKLEGRPLGVYRCRHCGFWHIGGMGRDLSRQEKARQFEVVGDWD